MAQIETPFLIFLALLLASASLGYAVRHQKQNSETSVFSLPLYRHDPIINDTQNLNYIQSSDSPLNFKGGEYEVSIGVGNPVKEFSFMIDTGSDVTWLRCSKQFFNPSKSSSYKPLSCNSKECLALNGSNCSRGTCSYTSGYVDKSSSKGEFAKETLSLGTHSVNPVAMGCGRTNKGFKGYNGILGLSRSPIAFPSQINVKSFSYCLVEDSKSSSTLEFNSAPPGDSVIVPMRKNPKDDVYYYYVELTGITVGEDHIPIPPSVYKISEDGKGGIIVDSGSTLTALDQDVYVSVRDAFRKNIKNLTASKRKMKGYETCYDIPSGASASSIDGPQMSFQFSNNKSTPPLGPANYLYRVRDSSTFCLAFKPRTENSIASIIGNVQQTGMRITYDLDKELIGFSVNKC